MKVADGRVYNHRRLSTESRRDRIAWNKSEKWSQAMAVAIMKTELVQAPIFARRMISASDYSVPTLFCSTNPAGDIAASFHHAMRRIFKVAVAGS